MPLSTTVSSFRNGLPSLWQLDSRNRSLGVEWKHRSWREVAMQQRSTSVHGPCFFFLGRNIRKGVVMCRICITLYKQIVFHEHHIFLCYTVILCYTYLICIKLQYVWEESTHQSQKVTSFGDILSISTSGREFDLWICDDSIFSESQCGWVQTTQCMCTHIYIYLLYNIYVVYIYIQYPGIPYPLLHSPTYW